MKYMSSMLEIDLLFSAWHLIASDHFLLTMSIVHSHSEKRELTNFIMTALYKWISKDISLLASIIRLELFFKTITTYLSVLKNKVFSTIQNWKDMCSFYLNWNIYQKGKPKQVLFTILLYGTMLLNYLS